MQESTTYQAILRKAREQGLEEARREQWDLGREEGRTEEAQRLLIRQGTKRFGKPDTAVLAAIESIRDVERLESLGDRIVDPDVRDWDSLLAAP
jgi:predicted transposase YdaD